MEMRKTLKILFFMVSALLLIVACVSQAEPMGSAFTYQGRMMDANSPANGLYDLQFKLYDSPSDGNQLASIIDINELDVIDGYLTVLLDFGSDVFIGNACWLEMGVRPGELNDPNAYTTLSPRQQITPAPYALQTPIGRDDTLLGKYAGANNSIGNWNAFLGMETAYSSATGNTFYGTGAGLSNTTGNYNTFLGYYAGNKNTTGSWNTFSGTYAGYKNTTANYNTFSGYAAGYSNTTGYSNIFSGYRAGYSNTTGGYNTFSGYGAGYYNTTGNSNTFSGYAAGYLNTTGRQNTFSGTCAGYSNTTGQQNTFSGYQAGYSNTTGNWNTFSGYAAGYSNTTGYGNTFSGRYAGYSNTTGNGNVFIGYQAGYSETGSNKLYIANSSGTPLIYGDFSTGRLGIGTTSPAFKLDVSGDIRATGTIYGTLANVPSEADPTVLASVKDGITWSEVSDRPDGLDDGDQVGITSETDPVYSGAPASGITAGNITNWNTAYGWGNHALAGYLQTETDPQVGSNTTNYIPKWNGSALVSGIIYDNGNVGIGTTNPGTNRLEVTGGPIKATGGLIIETRTSDPSSPVTGQMWLRTDL